MKSIIQSKTPPLSTPILVALCFYFLPHATAVTPPPDGGYPGGNTAEGLNAMLSLTTGGYNTAVGWYSLRSNTEGLINTATGAGTLFFNTGDSNTAMGAGALLSNTTGHDNTANGAFALFSNITGFRNVAIGGEALFSNTTGTNNIAIGLDALHDNTEGFSNVAVGGGSLSNNTTGAENTAIGLTALGSNTTGNWNTVLGSRAGLLTTGSGNTAVGREAAQNITGNNNVCIGIGVHGEADVDDSTYIRNINTTTQSFSAGVNDYVTVRLSDGRLGHTTVVSSRRYKEDIKPLAAASHSLYDLKPVSFRLKKQFDPTQALNFGLIAEEVEKVNGDLVFRNDKGQVESVRYDMVNAMLLNEFLNEHRKVQEQEATIAQLKRDLKNVLARLEAQDSKIEQVTNQIELSGATKQVVSE
jgi:hypothetical protein